VAANDRKRGLGRGLSALMADVVPESVQRDSSSEVSTGLQMLPIELIVPNAQQPRKRFAESELEDLTISISEKGIIQPLIVRPTSDGLYQIVAGERRWRGAQRAKLHEVPVVIRDFSDGETLEIAIVENVQRSDLNPIEEAQGYQQLIERFGHTQADIAKAVGKSRSHIANILRLLQLPSTVLEHIQSGALSMGHARALITSDDPARLAEHVISEGLSVRKTEALSNLSVRHDKSTSPHQPTEGQQLVKDADTRTLEGDLSAATGMKVTISHSQNSAGGQVSIRYRSLEQLDDLCRRLAGD